MKVIQEKLVEDLTPPPRLFLGTRELKVNGPNHLKNVGKNFNDVFVNLNGLGSANATL